MANKDKFKKMQQGGGSSFQDMVQQAATVAAIEKQAEQPSVKQENTQKGGDNQSPSFTQTHVQEQRFMRLPNPQIPIAEYNLVTRYCEQFSNMTRQDFVELAIIEKLWQEKLMSDEDFECRKTGICARPPRGHRKGTKNPPTK
jgi:hypothetical protein